MKKLAVIISPNWKDYAHKYLADCLVGVRAQKFDGQVKLFLVDNESSHESLAYLQQAAPEAEILVNKNNDGFAKGNNDAMRVALKQGFDYILLLNMDAVPHENAFTELVSLMESDEKIAAVQARLMLWQNKEVINSIGNATHFLGFGYSLGYGQTYSNQLDKKLTNRAIAYPSGAGVLLRSAALRVVGLFDEEFWMYNEDQDLGWRLWLAGYKCVLAKDAVIYHKYEFSRSIQKYYWMDRNRILVILKNYRLLTLILIFKALLLMELGLLLFAIMRGWLPQKLRVYGYFCKASTWRYILQARKQSRQLRKISDRRASRLFVGKILYQEIDNILLRVANILFFIYWKIVRVLLFW